MTINIANNDPRINYTATAGQTVFTVPFEFFDNTDIKVYIEGTLKTITTHYTVSGGNGSTGTVTLVTGATLNDEVTLVRDVPMERTTDLTSSYNGSSIDAQLDRIVAQIADLDDKASRTIQINDYELASGLLLPALDSRKGKTIQFNTSTGALEVGPTGADLTAIGSVTTEIATLAGISSNITTVAGSNAQVVAVGNAMTSITAINSALTNVNTVAGAISNINSVGGSIADVNDVADSLGEISAVQAKLTNIDTVAVASTNIGTVAGSISQVNSVASKIADVTGVNSNISAITTANANSTNINLVASNIDDVNDVGTVITKVTTVADNIANVNLVAPNAQYLSDVANNITAINAIAPLADDLTNVTDNLTAIQNAGTNATNAASSATSAATDATAAQTAKTAAETALDEFTDIYLGSKSVAPTVDNDGNALATGSIYWNSGVDQLYIWDGTAWDDAAFTASGAVTSFNTRTGAVTLSSADVTNAAGLLTTGGTMTGDLSFGDNDKAIFGAGSDLQIYHDGSDSFVKESGTGNLNLASNGTGVHIVNDTDNETMATFHKNGASTLYYDNAPKLATTSTGVDVTGTVTSDGLTVETSASDTGVDLVLDGNKTSNGGIGSIIFNNSGDSVGMIRSNRASANDAADLLFYTQATGGANTKRLNIANNGDISFYEDTGTTAKLFWDASAESLGIGQGVFSGTQALNLKGEGIAIKNDKSGSSNNWSLIRNTGTSSTSNVSFVTGAGEAMVLAHNKNVGIGTGSPAEELDISADAPSMQLSSTNASGRNYGLQSTNNGKFAFYDGTAGVNRMVISSDGSVGIGTSSPSRNLTVSSSGQTDLAIIAASGSSAQLCFGDGDDDNVGQIEYSHPTDSMRFYTQGTEQMRIDSNGNLLVGTTTEGTAGANQLTVAGSGNTGITIRAGASSGSAIYMSDATSGAGEYAGYISYSHGANAMTFASNSSERMRIDSSGNVGIGTSSPNTGLSVVTGSANGIELGQDSDASTDSARLFFSTSAGSNAIHSSSGAMRFFTGSTAGSSTGSEAMRIDSSGNVLVGMTSSSSTVAGFRVIPNDFMSFTTTSSDAGDRALLLNRQSSDGIFIELRKGNSSVGSIGTIGTDIYIGTTDTGLRFLDSSNAIIPTRGDTGATRDNAIDFGTGSARFDDIYATNSTIQTSDFNEKQDIASLTATEMLVGARISALFKTFRWKDSVAEKGDNARTHTGVIAQDVQAAFTTEGLDAGDYSLFISTTWFVDAEGNEVEEGTEGAVSKTRMGIRYPELLSFVAAYNEQRFASIEARLTALEG